MTLNIPQTLGVTHAVIYITKLKLHSLETLYSRSRYFYHDLNARVIDKSWYNHLSQFHFVQESVDVKANTL